MAEYTEYKNEGIWQHFLREKQGQSAKCKLCKTVLKTVGGSTKGLHEHLKRMHDLSVLKRQKNNEESDDPPAAAKRKGPTPGAMMKYMLDKSENSLQATIAHMTARDGLPFRPFVTSPDLRKCLMALGFSHLPTSAESVKRMVMEHGGQVRSAVVTDMARKKAKGQRFSLTLDEWTSGRNRRYMNINIHEEGGNFWSLGLARVHGSMPADTCVAILQMKLAEFGLSLTDDIVCICTDGASVMVKVGKLIAAEQHLCYAHGVQLAVLDVLYRRRSQVCASATATASASSAAKEDVSATATEEADNSDADDNDDDEQEQLMEIVTENYDVVMELSPEYRTVVNKVRKIVKLFRRSPTKNDATLQPYVKQEFGKELSLTLDCPTRWNSLVAMLSRFKQLRGPVQKALIDLGVGHQCDITDGDYAVISDMLCCLEPLQLAVTALCRRDTNLLSAEAALKFCMLQLQKQSSELAKTLAQVLGARIQERRGLYSAVLQYLHSNTAKQTATDIFTIPNNDVIRKFVRGLVTRLEQKKSSAATASTSSAQGEPSESEASSEPTEPEPNIQQQLELAMRQSVETSAETTSSDSQQNAAKKIDAAIKAEMAVFLSSGKRGRWLEQAYRYLLSIPPTSVEAERAFSGAGVLCTKLRSRLDDKTLDTLCFLRSYYRKE